MKYAIILQTWYQEVGEQKEKCHDGYFGYIDEAVEYLVKHWEYIVDAYPVEEITIKPIQLNYPPTPEAVG